MKNKLLALMIIDINLYYASASTDKPISPHR